MKKILLLCLITFFYSCTLQQEKEAAEKKEKETRINDEVDKELKTGVRNDEIFLGYKFGMSDSAFKVKTQQLLDNKELFVDGFGTITCKMDIGGGIMYEGTVATFSPSYYHGKLYELGLSVKSPNIESQNLILLLTQIEDLYSKKYGNTMLMFHGLLPDTFEYYWIDGNRQIIIFQGINDVRIFYTDLIAEKEMEKEKNADNIANEKKTKSKI